VPSLSQSRRRDTLAAILHKNAMFDNGDSFLNLFARRATSESANLHLL
jgi:hypothetical protein